MRDIKKKPRPRNKTLTVTIGLGPNLSVSLPPTMPKRVIRNIRRLAAPESTARVQPNSVNIGSKKNTKDNRYPSGHYHYAEGSHNYNIAIEKLGLPIFNQV